jgi:hypothetical protein
MILMALEMPPSQLKVMSRGQSPSPRFSRPWERTLRHRYLMVGRSSFHQGTIGIETLLKRIHIIEGVETSTPGLRFGHSGGRRSRLTTAAAAALGTVFDIIPAVGPFFAPSEGETANWANFRGQVGLNALFGHSRGGTKRESYRACQLVDGGCMGRSAAAVAAVDGSCAGMQDSGGSSNKVRRN